MYTYVIAIRRGWFIHSSIYYLLVPRHWKSGWFMANL